MCQHLTNPQTDTIVLHDWLLSHEGVGLGLWNLSVCFQAACHGAVEATVWLEDYYNSWYTSLSVGRLDELQQYIKQLS